MKSPITDKEMVFAIKEETIQYKGKQITFLHESWLCTDTGESFTTTEQDDINLDQILDEYNKLMGNENNDVHKDRR